MTKEPTSGLLVSLFVLMRDGRAEDCTNGGLSSRFDTFVLQGEDGKAIGPFRGSNDRPLLCVVRRNIMGREYLHVEPVFAPGQIKPGLMAGGRYVGTSDGRFPNAYPLSLHDRIEQDGWQTWHVNDRGEVVQGEESR